MPAVAHKAANGQIFGASGAFEGDALPSDCIIAIHSGDMPAAIAGKFAMPTTNARMVRLAITLLSKEMAWLRRMCSLFHRGQRRRNLLSPKSNGIVIELPNGTRIPLKCPQRTRIHSESPRCSLRRHPFAIRGIEMCQGNVALIVVNEKFPSADLPHMSEFEGATSTVTGLTAT